MNKGNPTVDRVADIKLGATDSRGHEIADVYWKTKDYAVFRVRNRISTMFSDDVAEGRKQRKNYMQIGESLARINTLDPGLAHKIWRFLLFVLSIGFHFFPEPIPASRQYRDREIARAIVMGFEGLTEVARTNLEFIERQLIKLTLIEKRIEYLLAAAGFAIGYVVLVLWWMESVKCGVAADNCSALRTYVTTHDAMFRATAAAALAGIMSVSMRVRELEIDVDARGFIPYLYGVKRIGISIIAGLFIFLALQSKMVFAGFDYDLQGTDGSRSHAILYVLAFLSGFSESFVPNVLRRVESDRMAPEAPKPPAPPITNDPPATPPKPGI